MPRPKAGESKSDYISRFMGSSEAQSDFPDEKQRLAVAYSMWGEKKNAAGQLVWPKAYTTNFIEPGVVAYEDLGPCKVCGDRFSCGKNAAGADLCQPEGATVLLKQDAIAKFVKSLVGKPLTIDHQEVSPSTLVDGDAEGIVTKVWQDPQTGWWNADYLAWTPEAQEHSDDPRWSVSCAYDPKETLDEASEWHSVPYASEILDGEMTHLALVTNPRYEGARIWPSLQNRKALANSKSRKGGSMFENLKWWKKEGSRKNAMPVNPEDKADLGNGKEASFKELMAALEAPKPAYNDGDMFETPHGEKSFKELKENFLKKNAAGGEAAAPAGKALDPKAGAEGKEAGHAEHREGKENAAEMKCVKCGYMSKDAKGEPEKLPDLKNDSQAEEAAKKLDAETKEKEALERQQAKDAEDKAAKERADKEQKEALENAKKAKEEAGRKSFEELRNARQEGAGEGRIRPVDMGERLKEGARKYGRSA